MLADEEETQAIPSVSAEPEAPPSESIAAAQPGVEPEPAPGAALAADTESLEVQAAADPEPLEVQAVTEPIASAEPAAVVEPEASAWAEASLDLQPSAASEASAEPDAPRRSTNARLARLHLRGGLLSLARAELEQMAGAGTLDRDALADLAEVRWRSGDLEGAAEAAAAHIQNGGTEPIAGLIMAEALDRRGELIGARAFSSQVVERFGSGVDRLFAGEPRSTAWPAANGAEMFMDANDPGRLGLLAGGPGVANGQSEQWVPAPPPQGVVGRASRTGPPPIGATAVLPLRGAVMPVPVGPGSSMRDLLDAGRAAGLELEHVERQVEDGDLDGVADRLALLLRMDRALAPVILSLADRVVASSQGQHARLVSLHTLRGDIYRGLGRDVEAAAAYQEALRAVSARTDEEST